MKDSLDTFTRAYIACALWSSTDDNGNPLDEHDGEMAAECLATMESDCSIFQNDNRDLLTMAYADPRWIAEDQRHDKPAYDASQAGHDFWLTRNGHGAGFWDRGLGEIGRDLSGMARQCGSADLCIGDDGLIYQA